LTDIADDGAEVLNDCVDTVRTATVSGGEPLLRRDLVKLTAEAREVDLIVQ